MSESIQILYWSIGLGYTFGHLSGWLVSVFRKI